MKKILFLALVFSLLLQACSSSPVQNQIIFGYIENNSEYRGGANPPIFLLDQLAIYNPSANKTFYIRNATNYLPFTAIITSFTTDSNGNFSLNLPAGSYAIICQEKFDFEQHPQATINCNYLQQPDFFLTIVENKQNYSSQYTNKANYCLAELPN